MLLDFLYKYFHARTTRIHGYDILKTFLIILSLCSVNTAQETALSINPDSTAGSKLLVWRYQHGDQHEWAEPGLDDSNWPTVLSSRLPYDQKGIYWLRMKFRIKSEPKNSFLILNSGCCNPLMKSIGMVI